MTEPPLDGPGVVALVGKRVAAGVAQHVRMRLEFKAGTGGGALDHPGKAGGGERGAALADKDEWGWSALPLQPAQGPELVAAQGMGAGGAVLDPPHVQDRGIEVHLLPAEVTGLGSAQSVPENQEDHGGVPLPVAVGLGRLDQGLDLSGRQVLPGAEFGVRAPCRRDCSIYFGWRDQLTPSPKGRRA